MVHLLFCDTIHCDFPFNVRLSYWNENIVVREIRGKTEWKTHIGGHTAFQREDLMDIVTRDN